MTWLLAADLALAFAALTAIAVAAMRAPAHWPIAIFLGVVLVADQVRRRLAEGPLAVPGPYTGAIRVAFHVEELLWLAWHFGLAAVAGAVFAGRRPWGAVVTYLGAWAVLVADYPTIRLELLGRVYLAVALAVLVVSLAAAAVWGWRRERPTISHAVAVALVAMDLAKVAGGPYRGDLFSRWDRAWPMHAILYGLIGCAQGWRLVWSGR